MTVKSAHEIAFNVYKKHYYGCAKVDDVLDELLELIDSLDEKNKEFDGKLRDYESNISGIVLEIQKLKNDNK